MCDLMNLLIYNPHVVVSKKMKKETFLSDHKVISIYIVWHISLKLSAFKLIINFLKKMK